jgi:hypothetical protein
MRKTVKEALNYFKNRNSFEVAVYDEPHFQTIKNELKWLDHYVEYVNKLETQVNKLEIENFDLKDKLEAHND